jgi:hypothetical protein
MIQVIRPMRYLILHPDWQEDYKARKCKDRPEKLAE